MTAFLVRQTSPNKAVVVFWDGTTATTIDPLLPNLFTDNFVPTSIDWDGSFLWIAGWKQASGSIVGPKVYEFIVTGSPPTALTLNDTHTVSDPLQLQVQISKTPIGGLVMYAAEIPTQESSPGSGYYPGVVHTHYRDPGGTWLTPTEDTFGTPLVLGGNSAVLYPVSTIVHPVSGDIYTFWERDNLGNLDLMVTHESGGSYTNTVYFQFLSYGLGSPNYPQGESPLALACANGSYVHLAYPTDDYFIFTTTPFRKGAYVAICTIDSAVVKTFPSHLSEYVERDAGAGLMVSGSNYSLAWAPMSATFSFAPNPTPAVIADDTGSGYGSQTSIGNNNGSGVFGSIDDGSGTFFQQGVAIVLIELPVNPSPDSITSAEAFGTVSVQLKVLPNSIATAESFGNNVVKLSITPTGIVSAESFGVVIVKLTVLPSSIATAESFGIPRVLLDQDIVPNSILTAESIGTVKVNQSLTPTSIASAEAFGTLEVLQGVRPTSIASAQSIGIPAVTLSVVPIGIESGEVFGLLTVVSESTAAPDSIDSALSIGSPTVTLLVTPVSITSAESFGSPTVADFLTPDSITSTEAFGTPIVVTGSRPPRPLKLKPRPKKPTSFSTTPTTNMLKDVIDFVQSRTDMASREDVLREINFAWREIWNSDDLPNSVFEMTVKPFDDTARIALPHVVGVLRGVKANLGRIRVDLNTPRPYYQDESYYQSPYTWRILGVSPLSQSITNATQLKFTIAEAEDELFKVVVVGPNDNAVEGRDQLNFAPGITELYTTMRFVDARSIVKDRILKSNVEITGANGEDFGIIPNLEFEARNTIVQITDKCLQCCNNCRCFDVLFKKPAPYLYYDEQPIPYPEVLMTKTLEWITLPKDGQEQKTLMYADKSKTLLAGFNTDQSSIEKKMDLGRNLFATYTGSMWSKI